MEWWAEGIMLLEQGAGAQAACTAAARHRRTVSAARVHCSVALSSM